MIENARDLPLLLSRLVFNFTDLWYFSAWTVTFMAWCTVMSRSLPYLYLSIAEDLLYTSKSVVRAKSSTLLPLVRKHMAKPFMGSLLANTKGHVWRWSFVVVLTLRSYARK